MKQLQTLLTEQDKRRAIIKDCADLIETEVRSKGGFSGIAIKTAFAVVKAVKPGVIDELIDSLLDEFVEQLQPYYESAQQQEESVMLRTYLGQRAGDVAESLLAVTDRRAERARNRTILKAYQKLRPKAKDHVLAAVPGVGGVLDKHVT